MPDSSTMGDLCVMGCPKVSRSIFTRANSARSRLISISSMLIGLLFTPLSLPSRCALTQLNSVWLTTPSVLATFNEPNSLWLKFERVARF